jgi:hypothetical protein
MKLHSDYVGKTAYSSSSGNHFSDINFAVVSSLWFPYIVADACCNEMLCEAHDYNRLSRGQTGICCINTIPICIDCLVLYVVIFLVDLICLLFFIPCIRSGMYMSIHDYISLPCSMALLDLLLLWLLSLLWWIHFKQSASSNLYIFAYHSEEMYRVDRLR